MRMFAAWTVGIVSVIALSWALALTSEAIHVPVSLDVEDYNEESGGHFTTFGLAFSIIVLMVGSRIGMAVHAGRVRGNVGPKGEIDFLAWLLGLAIYGAVGAFLYLVSGRFHTGFTHSAVFALDIGSAIGIAWLMNKWRTKRLLSLPRDGSM